MRAVTRHCLEQRYALLVGGDLASAAPGCLAVPTTFERDATTVGDNHVVAAAAAAAVLIGELVVVVCNDLHNSAGDGHSDAVRRAHV